jgi:hypothetical protein
MTKDHEKLLVAALTGVIIAGAAIFAIQPTIAQPIGLTASSQHVVPSHAILDLRLGKI